MNGVPEAVLVAATIGNGLLAGVFFAFSCGVMPGLRRVDDISYVKVFRAINRSIVNGLFILVFMGTPIATAAATAMHLDATHREALDYLVTGLVLCLFSLAVTVLVNVPLNNRLGTAPTGGAQLRKARDRQPLISRRESSGGRHMPPDWLPGTIRPPALAIADSVSRTLASPSRSIRSDGKLRRRHRFQRPRPSDARTMTPTTTVHDTTSIGSSDLAEPLSPDGTPVIGKPRQPWRSRRRSCTRTRSRQVALIWLGPELSMASPPEHPLSGHASWRQR
jgi:uncharacterized membrane protein